MDELDFQALLQTIVREELAGLLGSSQYQFQRDLKIFDGRNIQVGYSQGTVIGTDANQKLGFFGTAPVVQQNAPADVAGVISLLKAYGLSK